MKPKYYIAYDEECDGWDLFIYSRFYNQFMWRGIYDNKDEAEQAYLDFISANTV